MGCYSGCCSKGSVTKKVIVSVSVEQVDETPASKKRFRVRKSKVLPKVPDIDMTEVN